MRIHREDDINLHNLPESSCILPILEEISEIVIIFIGSQKICNYINYMKLLDNFFPWGGLFLYCTSFFEPLCLPRESGVLHETPKSMKRQDSR